MTSLLGLSRGVIIRPAADAAEPVHGGIQEISPTKLSRIGLLLAPKP
jgi:hypothetical protein